jgi:S1-C subfamily serine protease
MRANVLITRDRALGTVLGSGVILKISNGQATILTNRHVIDPNFSSRSSDGNISDISPVHVIAIDHTRSEGTVTWLAPAGIDLAIVSAPCDSKEVRSVEWPARAALTVGAPVFAIGNPNSWGWTHTSGTISQFRRWSIGGRDLDIIQTTAAISAGNSGGGLYDREGRLIGINTWTDDKSVTEGISFTIAIEELIKLTPPIPLQVESTPGEPKP